MRKKDITDLRNKTITELIKLASDLRSQINKTQMEIAMRKTKNTNQAANLKRKLAATLNIRRELELNAKS